jgi:hypothetical protein
LRERELDGLVLGEAREVVGCLRRSGRRKSERDGRERGDGES